MRIVVHDYAGHPGEAYLSRALGRRGHEVLHLYFGSNETPRGAVVKQPGDAPTFQVEGIFLEKPFQKHTYVRRVLQEIEYGRLMVDRIAKFKPDVVLCGCTPMLPQARLVKKCREWNAGFVFWVMDLYGKAVMAGLRRKLPGIGHLAGAYFTQLEKKLLRQSDRIVVITEGFASTIDKWGLPKDRIDVEPLWPPIDEFTGIAQGERLVAEAWLRTHYKPHLWGHTRKQAQSGNARGFGGAISISQRRSGNCAFRRGRAALPAEAQSGSGLGESCAHAVSAV